jgi:cell division septum initiation protein DivIVA
LDQPNLKKLLEIVEDLEAKFIETNIQHKTDIDKLKDELNHMQLHLAEKDSKIYLLEKEMSTLRANCCASKESLNSKASASRWKIFLKWREQVYLPNRKSQRKILKY